MGEVKEVVGEKGEVVFGAVDQGVVEDDGGGVPSGEDGVGSAKDLLSAAVGCEELLLRYFGLEVEAVELGGGGSSEQEHVDLLGNRVGGVDQGEIGKVMREAGFVGRGGGVRVAVAAGEGQDVDGGDGGEVVEEGGVEEVTCLG